MNEWEKLAGQLAMAGLPSLGSILGGAAGTALVPGLGTVAGSSIGGALGKAAATAVGAALGVEPTPDAIAAKVAADPAAAQVALARIEADARIQLASLQDVASARQMLVSLEQEHAASGKAPALLSLVSVVGFFIVVGALFFMRQEIPASVNTLLSLVVGALVTRYGQVFDFWLGSSRSSQKKDGAIGAALTQASAGARPQG